MCEIQHHWVKASMQILTPVRVYRTIKTCQRQGQRRTSVLDLLMVKTKKNIHPNSKIETFDGKALGDAIED